MPRVAMFRSKRPLRLSSMHVDYRPGDRASACNAVMDAIAVWARRYGERAIVSRCESCGCLRSDRIAVDDDPWALMWLVERAISQPPFPIASERET
jgi:ribosome biogenesis GTPase / thiamine phosphate phosphatase